MLLFLMLLGALQAQSACAFAVETGTEVLKWKFMFEAGGFIKLHEHVVSLYYKLASSYNLQIKVI
jgi:hypothetical protein